MSTRILKADRLNKVLSSKVFRVAFSFLLLPMIALLSAQEPQQLVSQSGIQGGLIVHIGCENGENTSRLRINQKYLVRGLDTDAEQIRHARQSAGSSGLHGPVTFHHMRSKQLPFRSNLVNLIIADDPSMTTEQEIMRILCPDGVAMIREDQQYRTIVKARPSDISEWAHFRYDASNNPVTSDRQVDYPKGFQWNAEPRWTRCHEIMSSFQAMVTDGKRVYYIMDEGSSLSISFPPRWRLIARDAFSGVLLWKKDLNGWIDHYLGLKRGPSNISFRLVAHEHNLYVTLGLNEPVSALDGATGEIIAVYDGTESAEELLISDGMLYCQSAEEAWVRNSPKSLCAVDITQHSLKWRKEIDYIGCAFAAYDGNLFYASANAVHCRRGTDGELLWTHQCDSVDKSIVEKKLSGREANLVVSDGVLLYALPRFGRNYYLLAIDCVTGEPLWDNKGETGGGLSDNRNLAPMDIFIHDGIVWTGDIRLNGIITQDLRTGALTDDYKKVSDPDRDQTQDTRTPHICGRDVMTDRILFDSRWGINFMYLETGDSKNAGFTRGACLYGIMPANGLIYAPPSTCVCNRELRVDGLAVTCPTSAHTEMVHPNAADRLIKGPAYGYSLASTDLDRQWPTYRGASSRSGYALQPYSGNTTVRWTVALGGSLTPITVAEGVALVAEKNSNTLYGINCNSGEILWTFLAGGKIDSPPSVWKGLAIFGCSDGWVYALRLSDGAVSWQYLAAPLEASMISREAVESVWPVHGSVLIVDSSVYCVAGRSMYLDGGLRMVRLDARTGAEQHVSTKGSTWINGNDESPVQRPSTGVNDILSYSHNTVYLRSLPMDKDFNRKVFQYPDPDGVTDGTRGLKNYVEDISKYSEYTHLYANSGFLDDTWNHRTFWFNDPMYGTSQGGGQGPLRRTYAYPSGQILCVGENLQWGFRRDRSLHSSIKDHYWRSYHLYGMQKHSIPAKPKSGEEEIDTIVAEWTRSVPLLIRAMAVSGNKIIASGPECVGKDDTDNSLQEQIIEDPSKGLLLIANAETGSTLSLDTLSFQPVFDGMAMAYGNIFMSTAGGSVVCIGDGTVSTLPGKLEPQPKVNIFLRSLRSAIKAGSK